MNPYRKIFCRIRSLKRAKMRGGISNHGRPNRTRGGISNHGRRAVRTRGGVQNCRTRDAAHTSHSQLNKTMDDNAGSNEKHDR